MGPHPGLWITKRATVSGLVVYDYEPQRAAFEQELSLWPKRVT